MTVSKPFFRYTGSTRYCSNCCVVWKRRIRCPWCGRKLRYGTRRKKCRVAPRIDPAKYGVDV